MSTPYTFKADPLSSHSRLLACCDVAPASGPAAPGTGRRALDIGGGEGYLSIELMTRGYDVVCLAQPGTTAAALPKAVAVIEADLDHDLPAFDQPFDVIVCGDVLEHLKSPARVLAWIGRSLSPQGVLLASLPNSAHWFVRLNVLFGRFPQHDSGLFDRTHLHFYAWRGWVDLFTAAGFTIDRSWPTPIPFELAFRGWGMGAVARGLERTNYGAALLWKGLLAYQFVVVARNGR